jgi:photosystem II stability/assembly factor-like uncharacterized protein
MHGKHDRESNPRPAGCRHDRCAVTRPSRSRTLAFVAFCAAWLLPVPLAAQAPDNPLLRWQFFHEQRAFPLDSIPAGALQRARAQLRDRWPEVILRRESEMAAAFELSTSAWTPVGPAPISNGSAGRISTVAVHPDDPNTVYIGGAQGGVWKTVDGGLSWMPLTDDQCSLAMGSIAIDPADPDIVYAGTGELHFSADSYYGCGVLRSTDGGLTWTRLGANVFGSATGGARISRVIVDIATAGSTTATTVFAAASNGFWISRNSGLTWTQTLAGTITDLQADAKGTTTLYAAVGTPSTNAANGVHKSADGGTTWTRLTGFPDSDVGRIALATSPNTAGIAYAAVQNGFGGAGPDGSLLGIWRTLDGGDTWTERDATQASCSRQCWYDFVIAVDPANDSTVWFGGVPLFRSTNGATSFQNVLRSAHVDQHAITFAPSDPATIYIGNDGGIYRSRDNAASWESLNAGLAITQFYGGLSLHPTDTTIILGGTQDNGTLPAGGSDVWQAVLGADGGFTAIDYLDPTYAWAETQWTQGSGFAGPRLRTGNGSFERMVNGIETNDRALFIPPLVMDRTDPATLYFGTYRLYGTTTRGAVWNTISDDLTTGSSSNGRISAIAPAASDPATIWVGTSDGNVQVTTNNGLNWNLRNNGLPRRFVTDIAVDAGDPTSAIITVSGFGTGHIFRTLDSGQSWTDISGALPDNPVNAVLTDPALGNAIYIGSDLGVFRSFDDGATWEPFIDGLPTVAVFDLVYNRGTGIAIAGTHGRSVFAFRPTVAAVVAIDADSVRLSALGDTARLRAVALDVDGDTINGIEPVWRSSDPAVVAVDNRGILTAVDNGSVNIIASFGGTADTTRVVVQQVPADITGMPASLALVAGETHVVTPLAVDANGATIVGAMTAFTSTATDVITVDAGGRMIAVATGTATVTVMIAGLSETTAISVGPPSTATVDAGAAAVTSVPPLSTTGTVLGLLGFSVEVDGLEPMRITQLVFTLSGQDPGATLLVVRDGNGNGIADPGEPTVAAAAVGLSTDAPVEAIVEPADMRIDGGSVETFVIALRLSGAVPNGAVFQATWQPQRTTAVGTRSGALNRVDVPTVAVASAPVASTVLGQDDALTFSENPVRSERVIFNFRDAPEVAAIYTVTGRLVADLTRRIEDGGRVEWDLRNDEGNRVAPGVYLVIFDVAGSVIRERLIVMPPGDDVSTRENASAATDSASHTGNRRHP